MRAAHRLAVDGDDRLRDRVGAGQTCDPRCERRLERLGFQRGENTANTIPPGNAVGKFEHRFQPFRLRLRTGPLCNSRWTITSHDDAAYGDSDYIAEQIGKTEGDKRSDDRIATAWAGFCQALFASAEFRYLN